jgi:hypothetical protein
MVVEQGEDEEGTKTCRQNCQEQNGFRDKTFSGRWVPCIEEIEEKAKLDLDNAVHPLLGVNIIPSIMIRKDVSLILS